MRLRGDKGRDQRERERVREGGSKNSDARGTFRVSIYGGDKARERKRAGVHEREQKSYSKGRVAINIDELVGFVELVATRSIHTYSERWPCSEPIVSFLFYKFTGCRGQPCYSCARFTLIDFTYFASAG